MGKTCDDDIIKSTSDTTNYLQYILCVQVDMDCFYAAVEMRDNPSLVDKPMAVGGMSMISTANYVARSYGVFNKIPPLLASHFVCYSIHIYIYIYILITHTLSLSLSSRSGVQCLDLLPWNFVPNSF
jgi:hypothetical protein